MMSFDARCSSRKKLRPKSKREIVAEHDQEALGRRLVEAEHPANVSDDMRVEPAAAAIGAVTGRHGLAAAASHSGGGAAMALQLGDHLLDRAARGELHDDEIDGDDAEEGGDQQQQAAEEVGGQVRASKLKERLLF